MSESDAADYFHSYVRLSPGSLPHNARVHLAALKGDDPSEWMESLRVREFPRHG